MKKSTTALLVLVVGLLVGYAIATALNAGRAGHANSNETPQPATSAQISAHIFAVTPLPLPTITGSQRIFNLRAMQASAAGKQCAAGPGTLTLTADNSVTKADYKLTSPAPANSYTFDIAVVFTSSRPTTAAGVASYQSNVAYAGVSNTNDPIIAFPAVAPSQPLSGQATLSPAFSGSAIGGVVIEGCDTP